MRQSGDRLRLQSGPPSTLSGSTATKKGDFGSLGSGSQPGADLLCHAAVPSRRHQRRGSWDLYSAKSLSPLRLVAMMRSKCSS